MCRGQVAKVGESAVTPEVCLAERVGFVPAILAPINDLGRIGTARTRQNLQKPEYQVQNRDSATRLPFSFKNARKRDSLTSVDVL